MSEVFLFVYVHVCMCTCVYICVHTCMQKPGVNEMSLTALHLINFFETGLSLNLAPHKLTSQKITKISVSPILGFIGTHFHTWIPPTPWVLGIEIMFSCLHDKSIFNWDFSTSHPTGFKRVVSARPNKAGLLDTRCFHTPQEDIKGVCTVAQGTRWPQVCSEQAIQTVVTEWKKETTWDWTKP